MLVLIYMLLFFSFEKNIWVTELSDQIKCSDIQLEKLTPQIDLFSRQLFLSYLFDLLNLKSSCSPNWKKIIDECTTANPNLQFFLQAGANVSSISSKMHADKVPQIVQIFKNSTCAKWEMDFLAICSNHWPFVDQSYPHFFKQLISHVAIKRNLENSDKYEHCAQRYFNNQGAVAMRDYNLLFEQWYNAKLQYDPSNLWGDFFMAQYTQIIKSKVEYNYIGVSPAFLKAMEERKIKKISSVPVDMDNFLNERFYNPTNSTRLDKNMMPILTKDNIVVMVQKEFWGTSKNPIPLIIIQYLLCEKHFDVLDLLLSQLPKHFFVNSRFNNDAELINVNKNENKSTYQINVLKKTRGLYENF